MTFTAREGYGSCAAAGKMDKPRHVVKIVAVSFCISKSLFLNWCGGGNYPHRVVLSDDDLFLSQSVVAAHVDINFVKVIALKFEKIAVIFVNGR